MDGKIDDMNIYRYRYIYYSLVPGCSAMSPYAHGFVDNNSNSDHCDSLCLHISDQVCTLDSLT